MKLQLRLSPLTLSYGFWFSMAIISTLLFLFLGDKGVPFRKFAKPMIVYVFFLLTTLLCWRQLKKSDTFLLTPPPKSIQGLIVLLIWVGITFFWCEEYVNKWNYFFSWIVDCLQFLTMLMLCYLANTGDIIKQAFKGYIAGTFLMVLVLLILLSPAKIHALGNVTTGTNLFTAGEIPIQCALACLMSLWRFQDENRLKTILYYLFFFFCSFAVMVFGFSKSCLNSFLIAFLIYVFWSKLPIRKRLLLVMPCVLVLLASARFIIALIKAYFLQEASQGMSPDSFSGRTYIWQAAWIRIQENPIFGWGLISLSSPHQNIPENISAHNEFLHIWMSFGLIGVFLVVYLYTVHFSTLFRLFFSKNSISDQAICGIAFFVYYGLLGLSANGKVSIFYPMPLFTLMLIHFSQKPLKIAPKRLCMEQSPHESTHCDASTLWWRCRKRRHECDPSASGQWTQRGPFQSDL
jgi:O-antigen ligase